MTFFRFLGLADYADAADAHFPVRVDTDELIVEMQAVARLFFFEKRECAQQRYVVARHPVGDGERTGAFAFHLGERLVEVGFPLLFGALGEVEGKRVGKFGYALAVVFLVEVGHPEVEIDGVDADVCGEHAAVGGEDITAHGRYGVDVRECLFGKFVPFLGREDGVVDQLVDNAQGEQKDDEHDQPIA